MPDHDREPRPPGEDPAEAPPQPPAEGSTASPFDEPDEKMTELFEPFWPEAHEPELDPFWDDDAAAGRAPAEGPPVAEGSTAAEGPPPAPGRATEDTPGEVPGVPAAAGERAPTSELPPVAPAAPDVPPVMAAPPDPLQPTVALPLDVTETGAGPQARVPSDEDDDLPSIDELTFSQPSSRVDAPPTTPLPSELPTRASERRPPTYATPKNLSKRRFATLANFAEALIPPGGEIPEAASDVDVAERIDAAMGSWSADARRSFERTLAMLERGSILSRNVRTFSRMTRAARVAYLERIAERGSPWRRAAFSKLKFYCANQWAASSRVEERIGFDYGCVSNEAVREVERLEVVSYPQIDRDHVDDCDVVVVGSGAGGSVVAKELAEIGLSVIVLEEGGLLTRTDAAGPPFERFLRMYRQQGLTTTVGKPWIPLLTGFGVGGSTLVSNGTSARVPDAVLARWASDHGIEAVDGESMRVFYDRVERLQRVGPVPSELLGRNAEVVRRGVRQLGLHGGIVARGVEGCRGCGVCSVGCPTDAKLGVNLTYLPRAQKHGAGIYAHARAERVVVEDGRASAVVASLLDPATKERKATLRINAKVVVLACGALHTPSLLAASALGNRSGELGRNLRIQPMATVVASFDEEIRSWKGVPQPYAVDEWHTSHGMLVEAFGAIPSVFTGTLPGSGHKMKDLVARAAHLASASVMIADTSSGALSSRGISYRLNRADAVRIIRGVTRTAEIFVAAGARTVVTGLRGVAPVTSLSQIGDIDEDAIDAGDLDLRAYQPVGTARMGGDPQTSVVDAFGEVHGVAGLFVADGSVLPSAPMVPPQATIMALATRTVDHIARHGKRYF